MIKRIVLGVVILIIGGSIFYFESKKPKRSIPENSAEIPLIIPNKQLAESRATDEKKSTKNISGGNAPVSSGSPGERPKTLTLTLEEKAQKYPRAREITNPSGFINTDPLTIASLIGKKVILVDFWTYSCINCQRTLPYLTAWYKKYKDKGLEIVSIHTPEFEFEKKRGNVVEAAKKFGVTYPIVQDNDYGTWSAYQNRYWPRKYLIDIDGFIVYDHIGEGEYDYAEKKIQELLEERMARLHISGEIQKDIATPEGIEEVGAHPLSPETYFGSLRNSLLGNGSAGQGGAQKLSEPGSVRQNTLYLVGDWNFSGEFAENTSAGAKIIFRYQAKNVYFVASSENGIKIKILRDGAPVKSTAGEDVILDSNASKASIKGERLYTLIKDPEGYGEHTLEIIIETPGVRAFTFTFG